MKVWYHANFQSNEITLQADPSHDTGAYVLLDSQAAKIYTSSYQMTIPEAIIGAHANWVVVWRGRAYEENSQSRQLLELLRTAASRLLPGSSLARRVEHSVADIIDNDQATLFRVE